MSATDDLIEVVARVQEVVGGYFDHGPSLARDVVRVEILEPENMRGEILSAVMASNEVQSIFTPRATIGFRIHRSHLELDILATGAFIDLRLLQGGTA